MNERKELIRLIEILDSTSNHEAMIKHMKRVIDLNPDLNTEEQDLLSVCYKNVTDISRGDLRIFKAFFKRLFKFNYSMYRLSARKRTRNC